MTAVDYAQTTCSAGWHAGSFDLLHVLPQGASKCRMEKAEILEYAVCFLQNIAKEGVVSGDGGRRPSYQDGVSSCLQRAAQFLGPEGKNMWLGLDQSVAVADPDTDRDPSGSRRESVGCSALGSLPHSKAAVVQMLRQEAGCRLQKVGGLKRRRVVRAVQLPAVSLEQNQPPARDEGGQESKQSLVQSHPASHSLWRPWP